MSSSTGRQTAIIAVHGVSDPPRGVTAEAVAALLSAKWNGSHRRADAVLEVPTLPPLAAKPARTGELGRVRWIMKSLRQSWRSDFMETLTKRTPDARSLDVGALYTDYLLSKAAHEPGGAAEIAHVEVRTAGRRADVFELYWADLSRVQSIVQILSELVTLLFRFSRLSTEALSLAALEARHEPAPFRSLRALSSVQRSAEWLFSRVLGPCAVQLVLAALYLVAAAITARAPLAVASTLVLTSLVGLASRLVYRTRQPWRQALLVSTAAAVTTWWLFGPPLDAAPRLVLQGLVPIAPMHAIMLGWIGVISFAYFHALRSWDRRFRGTLVTSAVLYLGLLSALIGGALRHRDWVVGSLVTLEGVLVAHAWLWPPEGLLLLLTVILYELALTESSDEVRDRRRNVLATSRLGLFASIGAFALLLVLGVKAAASQLIKLVPNLTYRPWYFVVEGHDTAAQFLNDRDNATSASFLLVVPLLLALLAFAVVVLTPSVLRELRLARTTHVADLGAWLTAGYRGLERAVRFWGWPVGLALLLVLAWLATTEVQRLAALAGLDPFEHFDQLEEIKRATVPAIGVAGLYGIMLTLGRFSLWRINGLRVPLDAALDVDNYFREFPRHAIPRVRIIERYLALLRYLQARGYERIVFVAHSQGTVITADFLRYVHQRAELEQDASSAVSSVAAWLKRCEVRFLTVGSPLRQLYAVRFPHTYAWVTGRLPERDGVNAPSGPLPSALGVQRWSNLWGSGDYVGRWLWEPPGAEADERYAAPALHGEDSKRAEWRDRCIGADAHTHYFDLVTGDVANELDLLVRD